MSKWRVFITGRDTLSDFLDQNEPVGILSSTFYRGVTKLVDIAVIEAEDTFDFSMLLPFVLDQIPVCSLDVPWDQVSDVVKAEYRLMASSVGTIDETRIKTWECCICELLRVIGINQQKLRRYKPARTREFLDGFA